MSHWPAWWTPSDGSQNSPAQKLGAGRKAGGAQERLQGRAMSVGLGTERCSECFLTCIFTSRGQALRHASSVAASSCPPSGTPPCAGPAAQRNSQLLGQGTHDPCGTPALGKKGIQLPLSRHWHVHQRPPASQQLDGGPSGHLEPRWGPLSHRPPVPVQGQIRTSLRGSFRQTLLEQYLPLVGGSRFQMAGRRGGWPGAHPCLSATRRSTHRG